jgi:hypothetical protein
MATGSVLISVVLIRVKAIINSCQDNIKENNPTATIPGAERGIIILNIVEIGEHPSIAAASSNSYGKASKYDLSIKVLKGTANVK